MKSRYKTYGQTQLKAAIKSEIDQYRDAAYDAVEKDCTYQALAVAMTVLHRKYGFGAKRLRDLKNAIEDEYIFMQDGVLGRGYTPRDCQEMLREKFGIDFEKTQYK